GGKATALAEIMGDEGLVVASDLRPGRAARIRDAALRLGLGSVAGLAADGRDLPLRPPAAPDGDGGDGRFDRVLLDAPCSGLGVLRRRPEARWRLEPAAIGRVAALQRQLLAVAVARARPQGLVAYCVCTLTREETLDIDAWAACSCPRPPAPTACSSCCCGRRSADRGQRRDVPSHLLEAGQQPGDPLD